MAEQVTNISGGAVLFVVFLVLAAAFAANPETRAKIIEIIDNTFAKIRCLLLNECAASPDDQTAIDSTRALTCAIDTTAYWADPGPERQKALSERLLEIKNSPKGRSETSIFKDAEGAWIGECDAGTTAVPEGSAPSTSQVIGARADSIIQKISEWSGGGNKITGKTIGNSITGDVIAGTDCANDFKNGACKDIDNKKFYCNKGTKEYCGQTLLEGTYDGHALCTPNVGCNEIKCPDCGTHGIHNCDRGECDAISDIWTTQGKGQCIFNGGVVTDACVLDQTEPQKKQYESTEAGKTLAGNQGKAIKFGKTVVVCESYTDTNTDTAAPSKKITAGDACQPSDPDQRVCSTDGNVYACQPTPKCSVVYKTDPKVNDIPCKDAELDFEKWADMGITGMGRQYGYSYNMLEKCANGCSGKDNPKCLDAKKIQCSVKQFELPQKISDATQITHFLWGQGQPRYAVYFERFPESQSAVWTQFTNQELFESFILTFAGGYTGTEFFGTLGQKLAKTTAGQKAVAAAGRISDFTASATEKTAYVRDKAFKIVKATAGTTTKIACVPLYPVCKTIKFVGMMTSWTVRGVWTLGEAAYTLPTKVLTTTGGVMGRAAFTAYKKILTTQAEKNILRAAEKSRMLLRKATVEQAFSKKIEKEGILQEMFGFEGKKIIQNGEEIVDDVKFGKLSLGEQEEVIGLLSEASPHWERMGYSNMKKKSELYKVLGEDGEQLARTEKGAETLGNYKNAIIDVGENTPLKFVEGGKTFEIFSIGDIADFVESPQFKYEYLKPSNPNNIITFARTKLGNDDLAKALEAAEGVGGSSGNPVEAVRNLFKDGGAYGGYAKLDKFADEIIKIGTPASDSDWLAKIISSSEPEKVLASMPNGQLKKDAVESYARYAYQMFSIPKEIGESITGNEAFLKGVKLAGYTTTAEGLANFIHDYIISQELLRDTYPDALVLKPANERGKRKDPQQFVVASEGFHDKGWFVSHLETEQINGKSNTNYPFFLASPCKTDVVVKMGECYVYDYGFVSGEPKQARDGSILTDNKALLDQIEANAKMGCVSGVLMGIAKIPNDITNGLTGGYLDTNAWAMKSSYRYSCTPADSPQTLATIGEYFGERGPYTMKSKAYGNEYSNVKVGCMVPCVQVDASMNRKNYNDEVSYNFCTYRPPNEQFENAVMAWATYIPVAGAAAKATTVVGRIGSAAAARTAGLGVKGLAFGVTGGAATTNVIKKVESKWPGARMDGKQTGTVGQVIDAAEGLANAVFDVVSLTGRGIWWVATGEATKKLGKTIEDIPTKISNCIAGKEEAEG